ncbi:MAG: peptide deformylase [Candidatus Omnitrophota bacterium]
MNFLEVKIYPDPCLRVKTRPVEEFDSDLREILSAMSKLMYKSQGIGLAATQAGVGIKAFIMDVGEGLCVFVNPEIVEISGKKTRLEEGCLSLPGITAGIVRPEKVKVRAFDENGKMFTRIYQDLAAKAVQHEMDHLNGKLIIDRINPFKRFLAVRELSLRKQDPSHRDCEVACSVRNRN